MTVPLYIFDLETLFDDEKDEPSLETIGTLQQLYAVGSDILIWSTRREETRVDLIAWLSEKLHIRIHVLNDMLAMRSLENNSPDDQLKRKWFNLMPEEQRDRLSVVFEHKDQGSVKMWRAAGVKCFSEI
jgi:hypothetical protein